METGPINHQETGANNDEVNQFILGAAYCGGAILPEVNELMKRLSSKAFAMFGRDTVTIRSRFPADDSESRSEFRQFQKILLMAYAEGQRSMLPPAAADSSTNTN